MKELERAEQEMLQKLQNTYQTEKLEVGKLQQFKKLPTKQYPLHQSQTNGVISEEYVHTGEDNKDIAETMQTNITQNIEDKQ